MSIIKRGFVDGTFGQLHFRQAGTPQQGTPTVLCLHMCPKSSTEYVSLLQVLGATRHLVAPDYPGYGESALPPAEPHVTLEDYAANMWQLVDALGIESVDLIGSHTGSMVAAAMARLRPQAANKIIMISAVVLTPKETAEYLQMFQPIPLDEEGSRFKHLWKMLMHYRGPGVTLEMAAESLAEALRSGDAYERGHRAAFTGVERFIENISAINHPVTLINPADGLEEPTRRALSLLKDGNIVEKPEWGFGFLSTDTDNAAELISKILND